MNARCPHDMVQVYILVVLLVPILTIVPIGLNGDPGDPVYGMDISPGIDPDDEFLEIKSNNEYSIVFEALAGTGAGIRDKAIVASIIVSALVVMTIISILVIFNLVKSRRTRSCSREE